MPFAEARVDGRTRRAGAGGMGLREMASTLPPGFRFHPNDHELVFHYLYNKVANDNERASSHGTLVEVDLHALEPWELPEVTKLTASEWYFFSLRGRKYATGSHTNRATKTGYWKATGKDREVRSGPATPAGSGAVVGMRKTLTFHHGRAPNGTRTGWVLHEFRLHSPHLTPREDWALCRVFQRQRHKTLAGSAQEQELPVMDASTAGQMEEMVCGWNPLMDAAMWQQYNSLLLDQCPQGEPVMEPGAGSGGTGGDESGFFFDSGFEDMASLGSMTFSQGWS